MHRLAHPFVVTALAALLPGQQESTTAVKPLFSFGVIADVQYADKKPAGRRHYRTSLRRLQDCVKQLNKQELAFVIQLGDFIDDGKTSFDAILPVFKKLRAPRRSVIGNHDLPFLRDRVLRKLELTAPYYEFTVAAKWRFVVLDGMDVSLYGYKSDHPKRREATRMLAALKKRGFKNAQRWNGGVGKEQLAWLKRTLTDADKRGQRVVLCCHFPILAKASSEHHLLWNHVAVRELLARHPSVFAWFNGHDHKGGYARDGRIHHVTFRGMVEATKRNAFAVVRGYVDRLEIGGVGEQKSLSLADIAKAGAKSRPDRRR